MDLKRSGGNTQYPSGSGSAPLMLRGSKLEECFCRQIVAFELVVMVEHKVRANVGRGEEDRGSEGYL